MTAHPSLPLFTDAYLSDTIQLSTEEHGAYLLLLISMWRAPGQFLPDDETKLARFVRARTAGRWRDLRRTLEPFFIIADGKWRHKRLEKEFAFVSEYRARQRAKSNLRWEANSREDNETGDAAGYAGAMPELSHDLSRTDAPSPSPSQYALSADAESVPVKPRRRSPSSSFPEDDAFRLKCQQLCIEHRPDLDFGATFRRFRNHAQQNDRRCVRWIPAWSNWIDREQGNGQRRRPSDASDRSAAAIAGFAKAARRP
jgi:uncharacterized protein YdaU (DUF1376 family)